MKPENDSKEKSELGITSKKADNFSDWYVQVILKSEMVDYGPVSGCMVIRPYAYSIWEEAQKFFDTEIKKMGVKNAYFPMFIPESLLKKEQEHVEGFTPEVAWVTMAGENQLPERLAIRPTSETIMYDSYAKWIRSHKDLPLRLNQWCNVVRWEFKHPTPFLRTREFLWQEGHTAFATQKEAEQEVVDIMELYARLFEEVYAVPVLRGRKTDSEKFAGAVHTLSVESFLPNGRAVQGATSHYLGQNFSKAFEISFLNELSQKDYAHQNSWGFSTRSIGVMLGTHGDDKGLILPPRVAPIQVVIVPITFSKNPAGSQAAIDECERLKKELSSEGFRVEIDNTDNSPGFKFNYWELRGVPLRLEIGPRDVENKKCVVFRRDTSTKETIDLAEINGHILKSLSDIQDNLFSNAKKFLHASIVKTHSMDEIKEAAESLKIAFVPWCGSSECEEAINGKTGTKSLNIPLHQPAEKSKCVNCTKEEHKWVYFGKSY